MESVFSFFHKLEHGINDAFYYPAGYQLEKFCNSTGLSWGLTTDRTLFWYRQPGFHIFEALFMLPLTVLLYQHAFRPCYHQLVSRAPANGKPSYVLDKVFGSILFVAWLLQVFFKLLRVKPLIQMCWLVMPCHLITLGWALVFLAPPSMHNYALCRFVAAMCAFTSWGAVMAAAFPDWSDHHYPPYEGIVFFIHHFILLLAPHYFHAAHGLPKLSHKLFWSYIFVNFVIQFYVQTPMSYMSGVNVNYHLHPHVGMMKKKPHLFDSRWYRFQVPVALGIFSVGYWLLIEVINKAYFAVMGGSAPLSPASSRASSPSPTPPAPRSASGNRKTGRQGRSSSASKKKRTNSSTKTKTKSKKQ